MPDQLTSDFKEFLRENIEVTEFDNRVSGQLLKAYAEQYGGMMFCDYYSSEELSPNIEDPHDVFHNLHQVGRSGFIGLDVNRNGILTSREFGGFEADSAEIDELYSSYPVKIFETHDLDDGGPGLHPFGKLIGKTEIFKRNYGTDEVQPVLLVKGDLEEYYRTNKSDHATRYLYEKFGIEIFYLPEGTSEFRRLSSIRNEIVGGRISASDKQPEPEVDFQGAAATGEERVLNWYYRNCLEQGLLFREFRVTNMLEKSAIQRSLDGLLVRHHRDDEIYKPTLANNGYEFAKRLIEQEHPLFAIEVHKWGLEGFGQLLGKATLLEDFWDPAYVRKIFLVKNNQDRRFERLDRGNPQVDMESVLADYGVELVIAPESV